MTQVSPHCALFPRGYFRALEKFCPLAPACSQLRFRTWGPGVRALRRTSSALRGQEGGKSVVGESTRAQQVLGGSGGGWRVQPSCPAWRSPLPRTGLCVRAERPRWHRQPYPAAEQGGGPQVPGQDLPSGLVAQDRIPRLESRGSSWARHLQKPRGRGAFHPRRAASPGPAQPALGAASPLTRLSVPGHPSSWWGWGSPSWLLPSGRPCPRGPGLHCVGIVQS